MTPCVNHHYFNHDAENFRLISGCNYLQGQGQRTCDISLGQNRIDDAEGCAARAETHGNRPDIGLALSRRRPFHFSFQSVLPQSAVLPSSVRARRSLRWPGAHPAVSGTAESLSRGSLSSACILDTERN
jgi:hypothetical protein